MAFIRRKWTAAAAENWTKEDWFAITLSALSYVLLTVGTALSFLLLPVGFVLLALGIIMSLLMYWIIDPKLKIVSSEYEKKQKAYLEHIEEVQRWEGQS